MNGFSGRLQLDFGDFTSGNPDWDGNRDGGRYAITLADIFWRDYVLKAGFFSDGASVPWFAWWFLPPWGDRTTIAALVHDDACDQLKRGTPVLGCDTRAKCDRIYREAFIELSYLGKVTWLTHLSVPRAWTAWLFVRFYSVFVERLG